MRCVNIFMDFKTTTNFYPCSGIIKYNKSMLKVLNYRVFFVFLSETSLTMYSKINNTMRIYVYLFTGKDRDANKLSLRVVAVSVAGLVQETRQKA